MTSSVGTSAKTSVPHTGGLPALHLTVSSDVHPRKAPSSIHSTELPIVTDVSDEQPSKVPSVRHTRPSPIVADVSDEQSAKAYHSIFLTELGMLTDVCALQPRYLQVALCQLFAC